MISNLLAFDPIMRITSPPQAQAVGLSTNLSRARRRVEVSLLAPAPPQARMAARGRRWAMICRAGGQDAQTSSDQRVMISSLLAFNPIIRIRSPPQAPAGGEKVLPGAPAACSPNRHQFLTNSSPIPHQFLTVSGGSRTLLFTCKY